MSLREVSNGVRCTECKMSPSWCYCTQLRPVSISTKINFLIHLKELYLPSNTANLLRMISPETCKFTCRGGLNVPEIKVLKNYTPYYLFPDEDSIEIDKTWAAKQGPVQLIIPDGTWRQAKKMKRRTSGLESIQSIRLPKTTPISSYLLRKQKNESGQSTFEATAYCLKLLEGESKYEELMANFSVMMSSFAASNPYRGKS